MGDELLTYFGRKITKDIGMQLVETFRLSGEDKHHLLQGGVQAATKLKLLGAFSPRHAMFYMFYVCCFHPTMPLFGYRSVNEISSLYRSKFQVSKHTRASVIIGRFTTSVPGTKAITSVDDTTLMDLAKMYYDHL